MSALKVVLFLLTSVFFGLVILSLWLRIALHYLRVSSLNPVYQLVHALTDPLIKPLNDLFKQKKQPLKYEWACFGVLFLVECLKILWLGFLVFGVVLPFSYILLYAVADLIVQPCDFLFYALLIRVIMNFANPHWRHPIGGFLVLLTEPLLKIGRRLVPIISGFDFSPFIMMLILKIISLAISNSLPGRLL